MFAEAIAAILNDHCTPAQVRAIESGTSPQPLTAALQESGFLELMASEEQGGGGASWAELHYVVALCGAHAVPVPLAQTLAARLLVEQPAGLPEGLITFAPALQRGADGALLAQQVPGGLVAAHVIGALDGQLVLLDVAQARSQGGGVHGSLAASLRWPAGAARALPGAVPAAGLQPLAALLHAALLAGAMKRCFDMAMAYANDRVQFGKSIGKFQAIQHQLSVMAQHVAASRMAAQAAFGTGMALPAWPACAVAKARTSEAAQLVATIAHAVHGAIGVTAEYDLQLYTRRLHEWRIAHGSETYWNRALGRLWLEGEAVSMADFARGLLPQAAA